MTTEIRYNNLLSNIPRGGFYAFDGIIVPHRNGPTTLRLITNFPNDVYKILINSVDNGVVTTDINGNAIFDVILPKGEIVLELQRQNSTDRILSYLTVRDYATIVAAIAEQLESIDDSIDNTLDSYYLERAKSGDIELAHGLILQYPNEASAEIDAYREMLQSVRQAERQFGGRLSGKYAVIAALTQINPLILFRYLFGPRWVLGFDKLPNGDFSLATRFPTGALPNINSIGQFVTLKTLDDYANIGSGTLQYMYTFKRLMWDPPSQASILVAPTVLSDQTPILSNGEYTIKTGATVPAIFSLYEASVTAPTLGEYDRLYIEFNNRGIVDIDLSLGYGLTTVDKIRGYLKSHPNYRIARLVSTPLSGGLVDDLFVMGISDDTPIGNGTLEHISGNNFRYTAPFDSAGPSTTVVPGSVVVLESGTSSYTVTVLIAYIIGSAPTTTDLFGIADRYGGNDVFQLSGKIALLGKPSFITEPGNAKVTVHDGPANYASFPVQSAHRGLFDIPRASVDLQTNALAGVTTVTVPIDTAKRFSGSKNTGILPFEAVVGYGYKSFINGPLVISAFSPNNEHAIVSTSGAAYDDGEGGDSHLVIDFTGQVIQFTPFAGPLAGVLVVNSIQSDTPTGIANFQTSNTGAPFFFPRVRWQRPGGSYGSYVIVFPSGSVNISSGGYIANVTLLTTAVAIDSSTLTIAPNIDTRNSGVHKILEATTSSSVKISYGGIRCSQPIISGVSIIRLDPRTIDSTGILGSQNGEMQFDGTQLRWHEPNDTVGSYVNIFGGGYFRIYSNNGKWVDIIVDSTSLPGPVGPVIVYVGKFQSASVGFPYRARAWSCGEKVKVIGVTPGAGTEDWELESPLKARHDAGTTVYRSGSEIPLADESYDNFGNLIVEADTAEDPGSDQSDSVLVQGSNLPDGWIDNSTGSINFLITSNSIINKSSLSITGSGEPIIDRSIPFKPKDVGLIHTLRAWVRSEAPDGTAISFRLAFDFGSGFIESGDLTISDPDETVRHPRLIEFSQLLPPDATQFVVRIKRLSSTDYDCFIERVVVINLFTALSLGNNTIPRSDGRSHFGSLLYVWCPDDLTSAENNLLGLGSPSTGIIAEIHNAHEQVDSFDVSDIISGSAVNVRGAITDNDWNLATLTNMEVVPRVPARFSYVKPTVVSERTEIVTITAVVPPYVAPLSIESDQDKLKCILFEDGVPVPDDQWQFNSATEIEIISGFNSSAIYTFTFGVLVRVETAPIDLLVPSNNGNDTWWVDYFIWNRHESDILDIRQSVSLIFDAAYEAILVRRSDQNKFNSTLTEDTGVTRRIIPQALWNYLDSNTIKLNSAQFNPDAIYSLDYNQQLVNPRRVIGVVAEVKSAASVFSLGSAVYRQININNLVDGNLRYHQIRITLSNIIDLRDVRIHSAVLKGLRLNSSPLPPGL